MDDRPGGESPLISRQGQIGATIAAIVVAFFLVRLLGAPWPHFPPTFPDSFSYLKVATRGPFHGHFYFDERPIGYPLFLWLFGRSSTLIVAGQALSYAGAFILLCRFVLDDLRSRAVAVTAVVFLAAVAIEPRNSMWNTLILSEGLSMTLAVLSIAAWWRAVTRPTVRSITRAWIATIAWISIRDTNVLPTVLVIIPVALGFTWTEKTLDRSIRRRIAGGAAVTLVFCGYVYVSQSVTHRTQYSVHNVVGMRVLPDPQLTRWFVKQGMPLDDALAARKNKNAWDDGEAFLRAPELARYRKWARGPGGRALLLSMLEQSPNYWHRLHHELPRILRSDNHEYDGYQVFDRFPDHWPAPLGEARSNGTLWIELLLAGAAIVVAFVIGKRRVLALFALVGLLSAIVDIWASYVGDPMEVNRHLVGPLARLYVFVILAVAIGADALVASLRKATAAVGFEEPEPEPEAGALTPEEVSTDA
jgi:hypothetical protein